MICEKIISQQQSFQQNDQEKKIKTARTKQLVLNEYVRKFCFHAFTISSKLIFLLYGNVMMVISLTMINYTSFVIS